MNDNPSDHITFRKAFYSDAELSRFGNNALTMFTLSLYLRLEDPDEFATNFITDGPDDKKIDICFLD